MISAKKIASKNSTDELCEDVEKVTFKVEEIKKRQRSRKAPAQRVAYNKCEKIGIYFT